MQAVLNLCGQDNVLTSSNLCQNSQNLHAARIENLSSVEKKNQEQENNKWNGFVHWMCLYLLYLPHVRTTKHNYYYYYYYFLWLEATELPVLISALVSQRTLPRSRRETTKDQHVHDPYSAVDGKLSLKSLAKTTSTKLQALEGSQHPCTLWVLSKDLSFYTLLHQL